MDGGTAAGSGLAGAGAGLGVVESMLMIGGVGGAAAGVRASAGNALAIVGRAMKSQTTVGQ